MANDKGGWGAKLEDVKDVRDSVRRLARSLKLPRITTPVAAILTWYHGSEKTIDGDNIAPTLKRALDGLRLAGVLVDDSGHYVTLCGQRAIPRSLDPYDQKRPRLVLSLFDGRGTELPHLAPAASGQFTQARV